MPMRDQMKDKENQFLEMATSVPFLEIRDDRDEFSIPELIQILHIAESGDIAETTAYADGLMKMYPDFDLIPFTLAHVHLRNYSPQGALEVTLAALPKVKRHYRMYAVMGNAEYSRGRLAEAIVWWSRSIIAQCMVMDFLEEDPFLYLGHAATVIGEQLDAEIFFAMADTICDPPRRLTPEQVDQLLPLRDHWSKKPFKKLIKQLQVEYNLT